MEKIKIVSLFYYNKEIYYIYIKSIQRKWKIRSEKWKCMEVV